MCVCGIEESDSASSLIPRINVSLGAWTQDPSGAILTPLILSQNDKFNETCGHPCEVLVFSL